MAFQEYRTLLNFEDGLGTQKQERKNTHIGLIIGQRIRLGNA